MESSFIVADSRPQVFPAGWWESDWLVSPKPTKKNSSTYIPSCFMPILKLQTQAVKSLLNPFYTNPMFPKQRSHAFSMSVEEESSCSDTSARATRPVTLPSSPPTWRPGHGISWKKTWKSDMLKNHQWNGDWNGKDWEKINMLFKYYIYILLYTRKLEKIWSFSPTCQVIKKETDIWNPVHLARWSIQWWDKFWPKWLSLPRYPISWKYLKNSDNCQYLTHTWPIPIPRCPGWSLTHVAILPCPGSDCRSSPWPMVMNSSPSRRYLVLDRSW